jgi:hypothetical protein
LNVDQKARIDLTLDVDDITESVQVQGAIPLVQTDSLRAGRHCERDPAQGTAFERKGLLSSWHG